MDSGLGVVRAWGSLEFPLDLRERKISPEMVLHKSRFSFKVMVLTCFCCLFNFCHHLWRKKSYLTNIYIYECFTDRMGKATN